MKIMNLLILISFSFACIAQAGDDLTPHSPDSETTSMSLESCNLVVTTLDDPAWALATSDRILRDSLCIASGACSPEDWYERIHDPCYNDIRVWKLAEGSRLGLAFSMAALGTGTFDGMYIREGYSFQLYYGEGDTVPFGPLMSGPQYVSIDFWEQLACDGFEPGTFFVAGGPGALSNYSIKVARTDDVNPRICFYVDCPAEGAGITQDSGHAFLELLPGTGDQKCKGLFYGFYPEAESTSMAQAVFGQTGMVNDDASHHWDYRICYSISTLEYNNLVTHINQHLNDVPRYNAAHFNCTTWIADIAAAGPINLPSTTEGSRWGGSSDPRAFWLSLRAIGNGGTSGGGEVEQNNVLGLQADKRVLPLPFAPYPSFIVRALHHEPAELAAAMGGTFNDVNLARINMQTSQELSISLNTGTTGSSTVLWGDETDYELFQEVYRHYFTGPGNYDVSIGVYGQDNVVYRYIQPVTVTAGKALGNVNVQVKVPIGTEVVVSNTGFLIPERPLVVSVGLYNTQQFWPKLTILDLVEVVNNF